MKRFRTSSLLAPVLGGLLLVIGSQKIFACDDQDAPPLRTSADNDRGERRDVMVSDNDRDLNMRDQDVRVQGNRAENTYQAQTQNLNNDYAAQRDAWQAQHPVNTRFEQGRGQILRGNENAPLTNGTNGQAQPRLDPAIETLAGFIGHWNVNLIMRNNDQAAQTGDAKNTAALSDLKSGYAMNGAQTIWPVQHGTALMGRLVMNSSDQKNSFEGHIFITPAENDSSADNHGPKNTSAAPDNQNAQNAAADNLKHYNVFWSDSTGHTSFTKDATWDGTQLTILSDESFHRKNLRSRVTWTRVSADRIDVTMDRDSGNGWTREFSSNYNRAPRNQAHGPMDQGQAPASGMDQGNSNSASPAPSSR